MLELAFIAELNIIATRVALGAIAIALAASCGGPKVHSFMLETRNVCRGQAPGSTRISWSVSGTPSLRVRYGRAANDEPDEPDTLTFLLVVTKGRDSVTEREDVLEFPAQFAHTIAIPATSQGSDVVAAGETNPAQCPPYLSCIRCAAARAARSTWSTAAVRHRSVRTAPRVPRFRERRWRGRGSSNRLSPPATSRPTVCVCKPR